MSSIPILSTSNSSRQIAATVSSICPTGATYAAVERGTALRRDRGRPAARLGRKPREHTRSTGVRLGSDRLEHGPKISQHRHTLALRELLRSPQEFEAQSRPGNCDERDRVVRGVGTNEQTKSCVAR